MRSFYREQSSHKIGHFSNFQKMAKVRKEKNSPNLVTLLLFLLCLFCCSSFRKIQFADKPCET
jgi:hypothetical protein